MVSGYDKVVIQGVHDFEQIPALRNCAYVFALRPVPNINKSHVRSELLHLLHIERESGIADIMVNTAMDIVSVKNHNVIIRLTKSSTP